MCTLLPHHVHILEQQCTGCCRGQGGNACQASAHSMKHTATCQCWLFKLTNLAHGKQHFNLANTGHGKQHFKLTNSAYCQQHFKLTNSAHGKHHFKLKTSAHSKQCFKLANSISNWPTPQADCQTECRERNGAKDNWKTWGKVFFFLSRVWGYF